MFQIALGSLLGRFRVWALAALAPTRSRRIHALANALARPFSSLSIPLRFP